MMFQIGLDQEARDAISARDTAVLFGHYGMWVPLNGGSDTRADVRECYRQRARSWRIEYRRHGGFAISIGGPFHAGRGRRYVETRDALTWVNWRKAKRLVRKKLAVLA